MTPEEAYQEALRRIREAERTGALELDLSYFSLNRLTPELARLTSLRSLGLDQCTSTIWLRLGRFVGKHRSAL